MFLYFHTVNNLLCCSVIAGAATVPSSDNESGLAGAYILHRHGAVQTHVHWTNLNLNWMCVSSLLVSSTQPPVWLSGTASGWMDNLNKSKCCVCVFSLPVLLFPVFTSTSLRGHQLSVAQGQSSTPVKCVLHVANQMSQQWHLHEQGSISWALLSTESVP